MNKETFFDNKDLFTSKHKIYFKNQTRTPIFGKFVQLSDHKELSTKGMIRFSCENRLAEFERTHHVEYTRIFNVEEFAQIKKVDVYASA